MADGQTRRDCYFPLAFAALTRAHRAFVAAMMFARPAGWTVRNQSSAEMTGLRFGATWLEIERPT